jgi:prophage DNA circulation protein
MTPLKEAEALVDRMMGEVLGTVPALASSSAGVELRYLVGRARAGTINAVRAGTLADLLVPCFTEAVAVGATFNGMDRVRALMQAETSDRAGVLAIARAGVRYALVAMVQIIARTTFVSRTDVDLHLDRMLAGFDAAELEAADELDAALYLALIDMRAACTRDLVDRARPLPRMVTYATPGSMPALALANHLYGDGKRFIELVQENSVAHPAFMPVTGRAIAE